MRIEWNQPGSRIFESGVSRGVLFPQGSPGVPWNGLVSVSEENSGGDVQPFFFDGIKYADIVGAEHFQSTIEAFSAPPEFARCEGIRAVAPGMYASQQTRETFGFSWRTEIGNDLVGLDYSYKLHLLWNGTAAPSTRSNQTTGAAVNVAPRSWVVHTVPPPVPGPVHYKPVAHISIDASEVSLAKMKIIEDKVYGTSTQNPSLPSIGELITILSS